MKVRIACNAWGNWYGYLGGVRSAMFFGTDREQQADAQVWLAAMTAKSDAERRLARIHFRCNGETYKADGDAGWSSAFRWGTR